jgi:rubrerythrin
MAKFLTVTKVKAGDMRDFIEQMNKATTGWTMRAARGECGWICSDCGTSFSDGMPDACA